jgi:hypothetical protein
MANFGDEFRKSYEQGRQDTRNESDRIRAVGDLSHDYSHRVACQTMFLSMRAGLLAGTYASLITHVSFIMAALVAFGAWCVSGLVLGSLSGLYFWLLGRRKHAREEGANWQRLCSVIYQMWAPRRAHFCQASKR